MREPLGKCQPDRGAASCYSDEYSSAEKDKLPERHLLCLAPSALRDCFPQLDVGDAFQKIVHPNHKESNGIVMGSNDNARKIREELVNVLGEHTVLMFDGKSDRGH
jgi:hypothetical protein